MRARRARLIVAKKRADADAALKSLRTYSGARFALDYPSSWSVRTSASAGYHDTTIKSPDGLRLIRVDLSDRAPSTDPQVLAVPVRRSLETQRRYRLISWARANLNGHDALRWEFVVSEGDVLLRKIDTFFVSNRGAGVAILVQAPASGFQFWAPMFAKVRRSLMITNDDRADVQGSGAPTISRSTTSTYCYGPYTIAAIAIPATTIPATTIPAVSAGGSTYPPTTLPASVLPATTLPATTIPRSCVTLAASEVAATTVRVSGYTAIDPAFDTAATDAYWSSAGDAALVPNFSAPGFGELNGAGFPKNQYVRPYVRRDGTFVSGYWRNSPSDGLPTCKIISC